MQKESRRFLESLMETPSPSGYEERGRKIWRDQVRPFADRVRGDLHGNSFATIYPERTPGIMLAGHIDEIGFQVKFINKKGFIYFNLLGGFDNNIIPGRKVRIHTKRGDVTGVIGRRAIHLIEKNDRGKAAEIHDMYIDIGVKDKKEAEKIVEIGDPVTYETNFEVLRDGFLISRAFDDKAGAFVVAEVLKSVFRRKKEFGASLTAVATVQEEVGIRGAVTAAYGVDPQVGIAIDVTHATDTPDTDARKHGEIKLGAGAVIARGPNINPVVFDLLLKVAKAHRVSYQIEALARPSGTDARAIQVTRSGVATGLISIPCRYMHTCTEVISLKDVENCITILTEFCLSVNNKTQFSL